VIVLEPQLEMSLREFMQDGNLVLKPADLERLLHTLNTQWEKACVQGQSVALLSDSSLRRALRQSIIRAVPDLAVIAYSEIPTDLQIEPLAMVRASEILTRPNSTAEPRREETDSPVQRKPVPAELSAA
jgi:flagellar biosynthesis protein FlhA